MAKRAAKRSLTRSATAAKSQPKADRPFAPGYGIVGAEDGKGLLSWAWVARKMMWGVWLDDAFFFSTGRKSRKGQNLAANPACTITNDDGEEAVVVEGLATQVQVEDAAALERIATAYQKKYKMDPRSMGEPIFRVQPSRVFGFVEKTFPQSATRWKL